MKVWRSCGSFALLLIAAGSAWLTAPTSSAATFTNNASIKADDPTGALTSSSGPFTVSCWFRISIPSGVTLADNMTILMDRSDGNESANFAYLIRFNAWSGNVEFVTRGSSGGYTNVLIQRPYLERWYHVAVTRSGSSYTAYVDGRPFQPEAASVGSTTGSGLSIGGINGTSKVFYGDIVEVAFYNAFLNSIQIQDRMFRDQRSLANIKGYYKLGYSTNSTDFYHNFADSPPSGTDPAVKVGTGMVDFEETDQAGEQSLFDSRKNKGEDAIIPLSGAFGWSQVAFGRPVPGVAFDFQYAYSSATPTTPPADLSSDPYEPRVLGPGWRHTFDTRIAPEQISTERRLVLWNGSIETWYRTNALYVTRHREYRGELVQLPDLDFEWTTPERLVYHFRNPTDGTVMAGRLLQIRDFNGNAVTLQWNEAEPYLTNVVDTTGANYRLNYDLGQGRLTSFAFGSWQVNFGYDSTPRLVSKSITNTSGVYTNANTTWQFFYNSTNGLLERVVDPRTNDSVRVAYDQYGRQTNQVDALGRATGTRYGVPGKRQITRIDPGTNSWVETYDRKGHILAQQDPLTNITSYAYDTNGNRISITEPLGWKTTFGYDSRANVITRTNALGEITRWAFHGFFNKATNEVNAAGWTNSYVLDDATGNLLRHYDGLGTLVSYTYKTNGLVETSTDANGNTSRFTYDTNGFLTARTDPATNTTSFAVNDVGWKLAEINALGQATTFAFDLNGNVVRTVDPLQRVFTRTLDPSGNLLAASDAKGQFTQYAYDAANQRTQMVDRASNAWIYTFTSRGKPERTTDPLGFSVTNFYDSANRLVRVSDPLGNSITNGFDANGNQIVLFDKLARPWQKSYDRLNRIVAEVNPLGDTKQTTYDPVGRIKTLTTPRGFVTTHEYDGRGRLTRLIEPETWQGQPIAWRYDYDGVGNITNITDALGGHYVMTYGPRNERTLERNQDGKEWQYTYDALLRLNTQTDPSHVVRSLYYDAGGRLTNAVFSTGRVNALAYDANDNPTNLTRVDGAIQTALRLAYDNMDRLTNQTPGASLQAVGYTHDKLSRVVSIIYPLDKVLEQDYDALGRLTNQVFHYDAFRDLTNTYAYDAADRLVQRTYPNGVVQSNAFDSAGQITNLTYSPLNPQPSTLHIALTYAYDRNGNKIAGTEQGTLAWQAPPLIDERSGFSAAGRITNRVDALSTNTFTYLYDENGNMTNASGGGQTWSLTYDEDNRVTGLHWDCGLTSKTISNRYDALGRRVERTVDGVKTIYVLDLSGGMERILYEQRDDLLRKWFVHGPDLCYQVNDDGSTTCFHADAMANVIALTDGNTNLVAQYAYTPYGRSLGSTNTQPSTLNSQPFTFVGSQGVMEELPGLYFMRARYYTADAGVFLSTEPVKNIGPSWKPLVYGYAYGNPVRFADPNGAWAGELFESAGNEFVQALIQAAGKGAYWAWKGGYRSLEGMQGAIKGRLMETTGGWNILNVAVGGALSFGSTKLLDAVEGKGETVPIVDDAIKGLGGFGGPIIRVSAEVIGETFFRYHRAGEVIDINGNVYVNGELKGSLHEYGAYQSPDSLRPSASARGFLSNPSIPARERSSANYASQNNRAYAQIPAPTVNRTGTTSGSGSSANGGTAPNPQVVAQLQAVLTQLQSVLQQLQQVLNNQQSSSTRRP